MQGTQVTLRFAGIQQAAELFPVNAGILRFRSERPSFQTLLGSGKGCNHEIITQAVCSGYAGRNSADAFEQSADWPRASCGEGTAEDQDWADRRGSCACKQAGCLSQFVGL